MIDVKYTLFTKFLLIATEVSSQILKAYFTQKVGSGDNYEWKTRFRPKV